MDTLNFKVEIEHFLSRVVLCCHDFLSGHRGGPFLATFNTPWTDLLSHLVHIIKIPIRDLITFMAFMCFFIEDFTLS
jgi:hypothetical protein